MARSCLFCGATPVTNEHVWPDWFRRFTGEIKVPFPHDQQTEIDGAEAQSREWSMPPFSMTVKSFCADCNNGWMSDIEEQASGLILPWFEGWGATWHRRQQRQIAIWTLLRAIVLDQTHPETTVVPRAFIDRLFEQRLPFEGVWVWLTACDPELVALSSFQGLHLSPQGATEPPAEPTVFIVTFTFGPLVFQVAGTVLEDFDYFDDIVYPQLDLVCLWPYSQGRVAFAPRRIMNRRTLEIFATQIHDDLQERIPPEDRIEPVRGPA